jgi:general secretion pathway protein K
VGWRQSKDGDAQQEAAIYAKAGLSYGPPAAPFDNALEIALLPGMTAALAERALPFITIFGGAKIDPLVADTTVLAALPGATQNSVKQFLAARRGPPLDNDALSEMAGPAKDFVAVDPSDYTRAEIVAISKSRRVRAEVVLKINEKAAAPYEILFWRDDFDGG